MELRDFISNTIYEICLGIYEAKDKVYEDLNNRPISPARMNGSDIQLYDCKIDFDLSITTTSKSTDTKKGGIITVVEASIDKSSASSQEAINKVKFSIPFFPQAISKKNDPE